MKTFKHNGCLDRYSRYKNFPLVGNLACIHSEGCYRKYTNTAEMCGGMRLLYRESVTYVWDVCPCTLDTSSTVKIRPEFS